MPSSLGSVTPFFPAPATAPPQSRPVDQPSSSESAKDAGPRNTSGPSRPVADETGNSKPSAQEQGLSEEELKALTDLKARDREVRAHESAHQAVGGRFAGSASYVYQRGPDGAQYAVGGEVSIDLSPVSGDPQATIEKMRVVRAAAMAPAQPSAQDRAVAAEAMQIMLQAQSELAIEGSDDDPLAASRATGESDEDSGSAQGQVASEAYRAVSGLGSGGDLPGRSVLNAMA